MTSLRATGRLACALMLVAITACAAGTEPADLGESEGLGGKLEELDQAVASAEPTIEAMARDATGAGDASVVAFVNVNVVPMDADQVLKDQVVLVRGDRIEAVGPAGDVSVPGGAEVIDGGGGYLMPGLADMHVHLATRDPDPGSLVLYLAEGTTTVRSMSGHPLNPEWRAQVEAGDLVGPTIFTSGKTIVGGLTGELLDLAKELNAYALPDTPEQTAEEVREQVALGWPDFVKVYDGLTEAQYLAAIEAANEAGIYAAGHALDEASLETILTSGLNELAHVDELNFYHWNGFPGEPGFGLNFEAIPATAAMMKANDMAIVSNMVADEVVADMIFDTEAVLSRPEYKVVRPEMLERWRTKGRQLRQFAAQGPYRRDMELPFFRELIKAIHDAGVIVTTGTDTSLLVEGSVPSGIHRELEILVEAGLSEFEALSAGTRNAGLIADRMHRDGTFGTVTPGQCADLLLLTDNPLTSVSHTRDRVGVMARGRWIEQGALDAMVADYVATY